MGRFLTRRVIETLIVFFGVTFIIYALVYALPGDPIKALGGDRPLSASVQRTLRARFHLDDSLPRQYWRYLTNLVRGDLGKDFNGRSVATRMNDRWPVTIKLALTAWVIEAFFGIALGVLSALRRNRPSDRVILVVTSALISIPVFVLAYTLQLVVGVRWRWLPVAGTQDGWPMSYLLPSMVIAAYGFASVSRLVRTSMLENLRADYVRMAHAKGLSPRRVVIRHVLRNSLIPAVTFLGIDLGYLLGGTVIIEGVFNLPGVGQLLFNAIRAHEGPTVVGVSTALILIFLVANVLVDVVNGYLDPRIRRG